MKHTLLCTAALLGLVGPASAEGLSFGGDFALGHWSNSGGGSGLESSGGIDGSDGRLTGKIKLSVANDFGAFVGQMDLGYQKLETATDVSDDDDTTDEIIDVTLRGTRDFGGFEAGLFLGYGMQNDTGDSDPEMHFTYVGLDASAPVSFGEVFGQLGYLDSKDTYMEGTRAAPFVRLGATYNVAPDLSITGAVSWAGGGKYGAGDDFPNTTLGLELGLEKAISDTGLSVYTTAELMRIYHEDSGNQEGDEFGILWVGVKYDFGGNTKQAGKLPNIGQWIAYNANEIE